MARDEQTHEIEGTIHFTSAKARLVEDNLDGTKYWIPKSQTVDYNLSHLEENLYLIVVTDWWWKKRHDFIAGER